MEKGPVIDGFMMTNLLKMGGSFQFATLVMTGYNISFQFASTAPHPFAHGLARFQSSRAPCCSICPGHCFVVVVEPSLWKIWTSDWIIIPASLGKTIANVNQTTNQSISCGFSCNQPYCNSEKKQQRHRSCVKWGCPSFSTPHFPYLKTNINLWADAPMIRHSHP